MKISVIIPVYNVAEYLEECLNSLINQTLKDIEIIIINDGSTDNSLEICQKYKELDNRIILIDKKNEGVSAARNVGLEYAKGEYIHFIDSDDYISPNFYEDLYNYAKENNSDLAVCGCKKVYDSDKKIEDYDFFSQNKNELELFVTSTVWNYIYKNKFNIKFNEKIAYGEDDLFSFLLFKKINKYVYIPSSIYYYRQREGSAVYSTINNRHKFIKNRLEIINNIYKAAINNDKYKKYEYSYFKIFDLEFSAINSYKLLNLSFYFQYMSILNKVCALFKNTKYFNVLCEYKKTDFRQIRKNIISIHIKSEFCRIFLFNKLIFNLERGK